RHVVPVLVRGDEDVEMSAGGLDDIAGDGFHDWLRVRRSEDNSAVDEQMEIAPRFLRKRQEEAVAETLAVHADANVPRGASVNCVPRMLRLRGRPPLGLAQ